MSHHVPCQDGESGYIRTGFEEVVAHRCGEIFSCPARRDGVVKRVDHKTNMVTIEYNLATFIEGRIAFPANEHASVEQRLKNNLPVYSIRVDKEQGKYTTGHIYQSNVNKRTVRVIDVKTIKSIKDYRFYEQLTQKQKEFLKKYRKIDILTIAGQDMSKLADTDIFQFGIQHSSISGSYLEQDVRLNVKEGEKVKRGDIIAYNSGFFEPSPDGKNVLWKHGVYARTAIQESEHTFEDSDAVTSEFGQRMTLRSTHVRDIRLDTETAISNFVNVGDHINNIDPICMLDDRAVQEINISDNQEANDMLADMVRIAPKAKYTGTVAKIDVYYACDIDEMHPSVAKVVKKIVAQKRAQARTVAGTDKAYRFIEPKPLPVGTKFKGINFEANTILFQVYITEGLGAGIGDKLVFGNSLKSIIAKVMEKFPMSVSSKNELKGIDACFSSASINNRIITSPIIQGCTERLMRKLNKNFIDVYRGRLKK